MQFFAGGVPADCVDSGSGDDGIKREHYLASRRPRLDSFSQADELDAERLKCRFQQPVSWLDILWPRYFARPTAEMSETCRGGEPRIPHRPRRAGVADRA
jgi:hypothetical protein